MRRRNLIVTSDDDDDADEVAAASVASGDRGDRLPPPSRNPNPLSLPTSPPPSPPVEISDDEYDEPRDPNGDAAFVDVPEDFSPPASATAPPAPPLAGGRLAPVDEFLRVRGLRLRLEWLEPCAAGIPGFDGLDVAVQARRCFEQFLFADMNSCGAGVLPAGVGAMHNAVLDGPFVLQVDEIVNISASLRERYHDAHAGPKRCLKLSMTDGIQCVFGMEYRPIKELEVLAPAGFKIVIRNIHVRRGLLMLVPEVIELLGGVVDELEAARDRLVSEVNKPPRGKRKQGGLLLSRRATQAAWPSNINLTDGGEQGISMPGTINPSHPTGLGNVSQVGTMAETMVEERGDPPVVVNNVQERSQHVQEINMQDPVTSAARNNRETSAARNNRETSATIPSRFDSQHCIGGIGVNDLEVARFSNVDGAADQMEHPPILSGENEKPFTYLYCMIVDWATEQDTKPYVQGKIKGLLTSVIRFQFRQCNKYELHVHVDDGSFISEAFVDHNVVHNRIGHAPQEVTAALCSGDPQVVSDMRETLKRFQQFLIEFEGTMVIELNRSSCLPVVHEMNEGCSSSDAWLLLRRLKTFSAQSRLRNCLDLMDTTP